MKIVGVVPARMAASRFPGKPLHPICGMPMVEHVFRRAALFPRWDGLFLATCDPEIAELGYERKWPVLMTSHSHTRALDRVAEAAEICGHVLEPDDVIVCVQGDEPLMRPDMIAASIRPLEEGPETLCTVLGMEIVEESVFLNPDTVKIIHDMQGSVLYTSRSPVPYCKTFSRDVGARRIHGIFAFRWHFLKTFTLLPPSPLELAESCDSNRIVDHGYRQKVAPYPFYPTFAVDSPADIALVEAQMRQDEFWGKY